MKNLKGLLFFLLIHWPLFGELQASSVRDLPLPPGYTRLSFQEGSYSRWLQNLPLKKDKTIKLYNKKNVTPGYYNVFAVIDLPMLFDRDLEQCADYIMRLWAEYHIKTKQEASLYLFNYSGEKQFFSKSGKNYRQFLLWAMAYSNSYSLKTGCAPVPGEKNLIPGDMFTQNRDGGIGHVSVILDICENTKGRRLYLVGYSFMPAQELHIEKATRRYGTGGWFTYEGYKRYLAEVLPFGTPVLRRFEAAG